MHGLRHPAAKLALAGFLALGACTPGGQDHGPVLPTDSEPAGLRSPSSPPDSRSAYVSVPSRAESYSTTFGFVLCSLRPGARITSVLPLATIGNGFEIREIRLARFHKKYGYTMASSAYPPKPRPGDRFEPVVGSTPQDCTDEDPLSEVQIGMRKTSDDGGGWRGAIVEYEVSGQPHRLEIPYGMLMCGASTDPC